MKSSRVVFIVLATFAATVSSSRANAIYTYTGNSFDTFFGTTCPPVCKLLGSFELDVPLAPNLPLTIITPLSFSFTDGLTTIDSANAAAGPFGATIFLISTDSSGGINEWNNAYFSTTHFMFSSTSPPGCAGCSITDQSGTYSQTGYFGEISNSPGSWSLTTNSSIPEPSALALLVIGALLFTVRLVNRANL